MSDSKGGLKVPDYTSADDLVHPNKAGYKVMEEIILKTLK
jgi:lysophospholipase L1-like esterase